MYVGRNNKIKSNENCEATNSHNKIIISDNVALKFIFIKFIDFDQRLSQYITSYSQFVMGFQPPF